MPNQLAQSKRRQSLAEHTTVLAAVAELARQEETTVMALLRQATRAWVRQKAADPVLAACLHKVVWQQAPRMPARFRTAVQVARFKRAQREFDQVLLDLGLATPQTVQRRNSVVSPHRVVRIDFVQAHAAPAI